MNSKGNLVALKRMTVGRDRTSVHQLREKLEMLASLAESHDEKRLLRLVEMITDDAQGANRTADLWFVLEPAVANTLFSISVKGLLAAGDESNRLPAPEWVAPWRSQTRQRGHLNLEP